MFRWLAASTITAADATITALVAVTSASDIITAGSIALGILVAAGTVIGVVFGVKYRETAKVNHKNAEAWESTARRLGDELDRARVESGELSQKVAKLELRPDLTLLLEAIRDNGSEVAKILVDHNEQAEERTSRLISAIERTQA